MFYFYKYFKMKIMSELVLIAQCITNTNTK